MEVRLHCPPRQGIISKMKPNLGGYSTRSDVVRAAESRKEIVKHVVVRQVDDGQLRAPFVPIAVEEIIVAHGEIEEIPRRDARRIFVVLFGSRGWHLDERRTKRRCRAIVRQGRRRSRTLRSTKESSLRLLIGGKWYLAHVSSHQAHVRHAIDDV